MDERELLARFDFLVNERARWEPAWKEISQVILPRRSWWDDDDSSGKLPDYKIYDSTAIEAAQTLADGLQGYSVSPSFKFFKLKMGSDEANRTPYAQDWLEIIEDTIYSEFNRSSFYEAMNTFFLDAATLGTACMLVEDDQESGKVVFSTRHPKEIYIAEDRFGVVDTVYRKFKVPVKVAAEMFGKKNLNTTWQRKLEDNPYERVTVLHVVLPRGTEGLGRKSKAFASFYIDFDNKEVIDEGGFDENPYLVWRWRKSTDETYGRGPGFEALYDALRCNQMAKTMLMAGEMVVNPPLNIPKSMKGFERIVPRGYNYYDLSSGKIEPINLGHQLPYGWQELVQQQQSVQKKFSVDFFLMLENLQKTGAMTATEVMERQSEKAAVLGSIIGRLNSECLSPLIDRVFAIADRRGIIPPPPPGLKGKVDIEYMGPLAQAQRRFNQSQGIQATLAMMKALVEIEGLAKQSGATSLDNFDLDEIASQGASSSGAPQRAIREKPDVEKLRQQRDQAAQAQMQQAQAMQQQQSLVQNVDKLNQPVQKGSMLDSIDKATGGQG